MIPSDDKSLFVSGTGLINLDEIEHSKGSGILRSLVDHGFNLSNNPKSSFFLALDHSRKDYCRFIEYGGDSSKAVLLRLEPEAIFPGEYLQKIENLYAKIITPGALGTGDHSAPEFGWGHFQSANPLIPGKLRAKDATMLNEDTVTDDAIFQSWKKRPINVSMVVSNKVSPVMSSNYAVRRLVAKRNKDEFIQIFGTLWTETLYVQLKHRLAVLKFNLVNCYLPNLISIYGGLHNRYYGVNGPIEDKFTILTSSRFTIVIENQSTYISEKIFDAIASHTVPIYYGAKLECAGLPKNIAIQITDVQLDIRSIVEDLNDQSAREILKNGVEFLQSDLYVQHWNEQGANEKIVNALLDVFK